MSPSRFSLLVGALYLTALCRSYRHETRKTLARGVSNTLLWSRSSLGEHVVLHNSTRLFNSRYNKCMEGAKNNIEWERFPGPRMVKKTTQPLVTFQKSGVITLNLAAYHALDEPEAVELLFSHKDKLVGIRKASPNEVFAIQLRSQKRSKHISNYYLGAGSFVKKYGIDNSESPRYAASILDDGTLTVDLKQEGSPRARSKENP